MFIVCADSLFYANSNMISEKIYHINDPRKKQRGSMLGLTCLELVQTTQVNRFYCLLGNIDGSIYYMKFKVNCDRDKAEDTYEIE